jgi:O-antigen/teichoic acid export membrane protein
MYHATKMGPQPTVRASSEERNEASPRQEPGGGSQTINGGVVIASLLRPEGGTRVQNHTGDFATFLKSENVQVELMTPFSWGRWLSKLVFGLRILLNAINGAASVTWYRYWHGMFLRKALRQRLRQLNTTVVYAQCPVSAKAALDARQGPHQRVVMAVHFPTSQADEWAAAEKIPRDGRTFRAIRRFEGEVLPNLDGIVYGSESTKSKLSWVIGIQKLPNVVIQDSIRPTLEHSVSSAGDPINIEGLDDRDKQVRTVQAPASADDSERNGSLGFMGEGDETAVAGTAGRLRFEACCDAQVAAPMLLNFLTSTEDEEPQGDTELPPADRSEPGDPMGGSPTERESSEASIPGENQNSSQSRRAGGTMPVRVGVTAMDQAVASISNFAVGVAIARTAGIAGLGAFSLVYAIWLVIVSMHRALITDPMAIEGDLRMSDSAEHVRVGLAAELTLGLASAALFVGVGLLFMALGQQTFGIDFLVLAPWLPFLLAQDYWRWIAFMSAEPHKALANDILFDVVQLIGFGLVIGFGVRSAGLAITAWGVGAAAGGIFGLYQFSTRPSLRGGMQRLKLRWAISKWLVGSNAAGWGVAQSYIPLVGIFLGPVGLGGLKAATSLVTGPSMVLIMAGGSVGLPEASKGLKTKGWPGLRRVERTVTAAGLLSMGIILLAIVLFGSKLLDLVYGHEFGQFGSIAVIIALSYCAVSIALGAILSLKATKRTHLLFGVSILSLIVSVIVTSILVPFFGLRGAAFAMLVTCSVTAVAQLWLHHRHSRNAAEDSTASPENQPSVAAPADREIEALKSGTADDTVGAPVNDTFRTPMVPR